MAPSGSAAPSSASPAPTLQQLIGQKLVVRMDGSRAAYRSLVGAATAGRIDRARLLASCKRILALKAKLAG